MTAEELRDALVRTYEKIFNRYPNPAPTFEEQDDRQGEPTSAVDFLGFLVYETTTTDKDIRGQPVRKWAIDGFTRTYSHDSGWDGDPVELSLHDHAFQAIANVMGLLAHHAAEAVLEAEAHDTMCELTDGPHE